MSTGIIKNAIWTPSLLDPRLRGDDEVFLDGGGEKWPRVIGFTFWPANATERFMSALRMICFAAHGNIKTALWKDLRKSTAFTNLSIAKNIPMPIRQLVERSNLKNGTAHGRSGLLKKTIRSGSTCPRNLMTEGFYSQTINTQLVIPVKAGIQRTGSQSQLQIMPACLSAYTIRADRRLT